MRVRRRERCGAGEGGGGEPGDALGEEAEESGQCQPGVGEEGGGVRRYLVEGQ